MEDHLLRNACRHCKGAHGRIKTRNGQDCVFCANCGRWQYNAPKTETGRAVRTVSTIHSDVRPKQKARILLRANGRCELCGASPNDGNTVLHVGHLLSVKDGMAFGLTEVELNDDENLVALCAECNLGMGEETITLRLATSIVLARLRKKVKTELF